VGRLAGKQSFIAGAAFHLSEGESGSEHAV
jgi:hypothetical protein